MRKIYIDVGTYDGDSIRAFLLGEIIDDPKDYEIFAIEPNPKYRDQVKSVCSRYGGTFLPVAAWTEDVESMEMATEVGEETGLGSSLMKSKKVWRGGNIVTVHAVDFSRWIKQFEGCHVVVKMDIEGAEFPVLEKMILDGSIKLVAKLYAEFHPNKVPEYTTTDKNNLIERLGAYTEVHDWH